MADVTITWLGHSTFTVELADGKVLLIDPWLEGNPSHPKGHQLERVDVMLMTHGHVDHFADVISVAKKFSPTVVAIYEICQFLGTKGVNNLAPMNKGGSQSVGGVKVTMTHAQHSSMIEDGGQLIYAGEAAGYVVRLPDGRAFYHAGDTCNSSANSISPSWPCCPSATSSRWTRARQHSPAATYSPNRSSPSTGVRFRC